jgi:hypothetical protein
MGRKEQHHVQQPHPPPIITWEEFNRTVQELYTLLALAIIYYRRRRFEERRPYGETPRFVVDWDRLKKLAHHPHNQAFRRLLICLKRYAKSDSDRAADVFQQYSKHTTLPKKA